MAKKRFKKVYVEITSVCNLHCSFCPPTLRPAAFITLDQFQQIVGEVAPWTSHIYLHVKGEPLLHPELGGLLDAAQEGHLKVHIVTNGTLIEGQTELLLGHPAVHRVNISLHSFENQDEEGRGQYLKPILEFVRKAQQTSRVIVALRDWTGNQSPKEGVRLAANTYINFDNQFVWPRLTDPIRSDTGSCLGLRDQVAILVDGTVVPCCLDEGVMALGNVFKQSLKPILEGPRALAISKGFRQNRCVEPLCQRCQFRERFTSSAQNTVPPRKIC